MPGLKSGPISEAKGRAGESLRRGCGGAVDSWSGARGGCSMGKFTNVGAPMEPDEVRAQIEQRKQGAKDLSIREVLWSLYYGILSRYPELMEKDPPLVYPGVKETFEMSVLPSTQQFPKGILDRFRLGPAVYHVLYREGPEEVRSWSGRDFSRYCVTHASIVLKVDGEEVFDFNIRRSVRRGMGS